MGPGIHGQCYDEERMLYCQTPKNLGHCINCLGFNDDGPFIPPMRMRTIYIYIYIYIVTPPLNIDMNFIFNLVHSKDVREHSFDTFWRFALVFGGMFCALKYLDLSGTHIVNGASIPANGEQRRRRRRWNVCQVRGRGAGLLANGDAVYTHCFALVVARIYMNTNIYDPLILEFRALCVFT